MSDGIFRTSNKRVVWSIKPEKDLLVNFGETSEFVESHLKTRFLVSERTYECKSLTRASKKSIIHTRDTTRASSPASLIFFYCIWEVGLEI